jgi:hypothetical protein
MLYKMGTPEFTNIADTRFQVLIYSTWPEDKYLA